MPGRRFFQKVATFKKQLTETAKATKEPYQFPLDKIPVLQTYSAFDIGLPNKFHTAIDWHAPYGTPVYAIANGNISYSQYEADYVEKHPIYQKWIEPAEFINMTSDLTSILLLQQSWS